MVHSPVICNRLPRWVRPEQFEPPHGCLLRLAECNGLPGTKELGSITGLRVQDIKMGRDLDRLAIILNCDLAALQTNSTTHKNNAQAVVGGHILRPGADFVALDVRRVCPICLAEAGYQRVWWDWLFVSTCPSHQCMLVDHCSCGGKLSWRDGSPFKCCACHDGDVRNVTIEPADRRSTAPDRWAIDRFIGTDKFSVDVLDEIPLGHAAELLKRIGMLDLLGYRTTSPQLSDPDQIRHMRVRGFELAASGTIDAALDRAYDGYQKARDDASPSLGRMYGWFYSWFLLNGGARLFHEMGAIILRNASTKMQVTRRAFSHIMRTHRGSITLSEAAAIAKVRGSTFRKILLAEGRITKRTQKGVPILVDRDVAERIAREIASAVSLKGLGKRLGLSPTALTKLVRSKSVPCWMTGDRKGAGNYLFRMSEIDDWMNELIGSAPTKQYVPAGAATLIDAARYCRVAVTVLVRAIIQSEIKILCIYGIARNFRTACVILNEVQHYKEKIGVCAAADPVRNYRRSEKSRS